MRRQGSLFLGLVLIGLGGIFLLRAMDVWPDDVSTWPGIMVVIGLAMAADQLFQRSRISWFGPVVLIGFGTFFLLRDFDVVESDFIWPAILIIAGIGLLAGTMRRQPIETKVINVPLDGASRARVRIDHGGGELRVGRSTAGSMTLCTGSAGGVEQRVNRKGDRLDVSLKQTPGLWARSIGQPFRVDFNPGVELELDFHTGATDTTLDLSGLLVNSLDLKTGASSTIITAPEQGHTKASVDAGAASVEVRVPPSVAARIVADTGLAEVNIDTNRFLRSGGGYESADYSTSLNRLDLRINGGVASFKVR